MVGDGRAELVINVSVRRSSEEGGTHETHRTHGTVADGTKGHKRQRDTLAVLFRLFRVLRGKLTLAVLRAAPFLSILSILWFPSHMQFFFMVFMVKKPREIEKG